MGFQDEIQAGAPLKRGPGRPRQDAPKTEAQKATSLHPKPTYDPEEMYRATLHTYDGGGHQGPAPGAVVTEKGTQRALLIPERPVMVLGNVLNESYGHAVIDERGPDFDSNVAAAGRGEDTMASPYDADGRVRSTRAPRQAGSVRRRFHIDVEKA